MSDLEDLANRALPDVETTSPLDTKRSTECGPGGRRGGDEVTTVEHSVPPFLNAMSGAPQAA